MSSRAVLPMRPARGPVETILEIESQQDELLRRLDELNARIEQALSDAAPRADSVGSDRSRASLPAAEFGHHPAGMVAAGIAPPPGPPGSTRRLVR